MAQVNELKILISAEVDRYIKALNEAESKTNSFGSNIKSTMIGVGASLGIGFSAVALKDFVTSASQVSRQMDGLINKFNAAAGSASIGAASLQFIKEESDRLGLSFYETANAYAGLEAATLRSGLSLGQIQKIFTDISSAVVSMHLSAKKAGLVFMALEQMASKGVVCMEELKRQLGDSLPGSLEIAAKSMGMTTVEFNKMISEGKVLSAGFLPEFAAQVKKELGGSVETASKQAQAEFNRLGTAAFNLKDAIGDSLNPSLVDLAKNLTWVTRNLSEAIAKINEFNKKQGVFDAQQKLKFYNNVSKGDIGANVQYRLFNPLGNVANDMEFEMKRLEMLRIDESKKNGEANKDKNSYTLGKISEDLSNKKNGRSKDVNIDLKTLGLDNYRKDFEQRLKETQAQIDAETALTKKELDIKSALRKQGLLDTSRDFRDELALRIDFEKKKLDITNSIEKDTEAAKSSIEEKRKSDILNISGGNAPNKTQAIAAINESAKVQTAAIERISKEKEKALLDANKRESDAKRKLSEDLKKVDDEEARRQLQLTKFGNTNDIIMQEQELADRIKAIHYQSIDEKLEAEINYIDKKKNLDIQELNAEAEAYQLKGVELEAIEARKTQIEEEARLKRANAEQVANEQRIQQQQDLYNKLGDISGNYLELMMNHELTKAKIMEMGQNALTQILIGGLKAQFKEEQAEKLASALMDAKTAASKAWANPSNWVLPPPANFIVATTSAAGAAAFPLAQAAMIASTNYRELGGPVTAGEAYIVGEKRPEVFVPDRNGTILPNTDALKSSGSQGQQAYINISPIFQSLDPATGQKMFSQWMQQSGLNQITKAVTGGTGGSGGLRAAIKSV